MCFYQLRTARVSVRYICYSQILMACYEAKPILPRKMSFLAVHKHNRAIEPNRAGSIC
jgi:hypothetical protein